MLQVDAHKAWLRHQRPLEVNTKIITVHRISLVNQNRRKIVIENGNILISDFSNDTDLNPYENWGELNEGVKFKFSKGYKRIN